MLISPIFTIEITASNLQVASTSTGCTSIDGKGVATFVVKSSVAQTSDLSFYCIVVVDLKTNFIQTVVPETQVQAGNYEHSINIPSGNYVVAYYLNGNMNAKKVQVK